MELDRHVLIFMTFIFTFLTHSSVSVVFPKSGRKTDIINSNLYKKNLVTKVSLTQKGYIQFLRYVVDVPPLVEYTFCIWVRSNNFTYSHPLLSYSKHEKERLIRVWISPLGSYLNLEILNVSIFKIPVHFVENEWNHVCQSWSSYYGAWSLYLNGKLQASGFAQKLKRVTIHSGGDIVVGQEYTDFDKGLDDGIEGDISGFNFVLASTFKDLGHASKPPYTNDFNFKRETGRNKFNQELQTRPFNGPFKEKRILSKSIRGRQVWDETGEGFDEVKIVIRLPLENRQEPNNGRRFNKDLRSLENVQKPLGLLLVELSYDCGYLRGAPLSGNAVLVSWTKTEVRVFGGAILKIVPPFCAKAKQ